MKNLIEVTNEIYAVYKSTGREPEQYSKIIFAALDDDGDMMLIDSEKEGFFGDCTEMENFKHYHLGPPPKAPRKPYERE